jgi:ABC-type Fe3+/spermidine/putrescine transport system ATPase subunit
MNVFGNISFGLRMQRWGKVEIKRRVKDLLHLIQLEGYEGRIVTDLSGGEQQRVALARALAPNPDILLLDEPLSALDARLRKELRKQIKRIQRELNLTTIYVTHDQEEALAISDKIVIMNNGRVEQAGTTFDIYHRPKTKFVANFVGITNFIQARVAKTDGKYLELDSSEGTFFIHYEREIPIGSNTTLVIRPEKCKIGDDRKYKNTVTGRIEECEFLGDSTVITVKLKNSKLTARLSEDSLCSVGDELKISFAPEDCWMLEDR